MTCPDQPVSCPVDLDRMLKYLVDESGEEESTALEEHLFSCDSCGPAFESLAALRNVVAEAVRGAAVTGNVDATFLERASHDGLKLCEYRITEGGKVSCKAGAEDLVVVRLAADFGDAENLRLEGSFEDLEQQVSTSLPTREVVVDRNLGEVLLVFPGELVRSYPRSLWTLRLAAGDDHSETSEIGPFLMDHTP